MRLGGRMRGRVAGTGRAAEEVTGRIIHPSGNNYTATTLQRLV